MPIPRPNSGESHEAFLSRCMGDEVMRREYPHADQRYAICHSRISKSFLWTRAFPIACACCKADGADVPEVQAVIRLLLPSIRSAWEVLVSALLIEAERQLRQTAPREFHPADLAILMAAYVTTLQRVAASPLSQDVLARVEEAVGSLTTAAAEAANMAVPPGLGLARSLGAAHVSLLTQDLAARSIEATVPAASRFVQEGLGRQSTEEAIAAWREELRAALAAERALPALVDSWAYQTYNAAGVRAAAAAGENYIQLVARIDDRTTRFCRLVNGRVVPMARVLGQLDNIRTAVLAGDAAALSQAAPFIDRPNDATDADVEAAIQRGGLAPFHHGCRTRNVPVRLPS